jgi:hypothetical protein
MEELIKGVDQRTLLYAGITRDGVFLIEHGEVSRAVNVRDFSFTSVSKQSSRGVRALRGRARHTGCP